MKILQTNIFQPISIIQWSSLELIDVFDVPWNKTIYLESHSSFTYLVIGSDTDIHIDIITTWPHCSCRIFWLFVSDEKHSIAGSLKVLLDNSQTSADVEIISFLYDWAKVSIDWTINIWMHLDQVHGHLLEQNIVLGKNISLKTLPKLNVSSHNVTAAHGANIDTLDQQKLFYMMSRGLSQHQAQTLLVDWYIEHVLSHFTNMSDKEKNSVHKILTK